MTTDDLVKQRIAIFKETFAKLCEGKTPDQNTVTFHFCEALLAHVMALEVRLFQMQADQQRADYGLNPGVDFN